MIIDSSLDRQKASGQTTPQPTQVAGTNQIERSADGKTYVFSFNNRPLYRYETIPDGDYKGSFVGLSASSGGRNYFHPAMCGGLLVEVAGQIVYPCGKGVSFTLGNEFMTKDSVALFWQMYWNKERVYSYWMSFTIRGKTLVIDIEGNAHEKGGAGITLAEATSDHGDLVVIPVPYLTLASLLYQKSSRSFTSMFFDWERTNCSRLLPLSEAPDHILYAQAAEYFPKSDGLRNRVKERIYLTVSRDINDVMPNVVGPIAPLKSKLEAKIIISYQPPYPWILGPLIPRTLLPSYLDTLKKLGITDVALLIKDWWWSGFDRGNPKVLPANDFDMAKDGWACAEYERQSGGGEEILRKVRDKAHTYDYMFGLHQNYVDMYSDARPGALPGIHVDSSVVAKLPGSDQEWAWAFSPNCREENAWAIKPARASEVARTVSSAIYRAYQSDWNYLDVTSSLNPSGPMPVKGRGVVNSPVDFDAGPDNAGRDSAGMFLYTLRKYRELPRAVRASTNGGPTQGEGGNHFLYAGYFDDFEARIQTAISRVSGYSAPLLVDFHHRKLRPRSSFHGAGHIYEFFGRGLNTFFTDTEVLTFIATEIAYGHGGLVTKNAHSCMDDSPCDHSLKHIALEHRHVLPLQKVLANATVRSISYFDADEVPKSSSRYIADHPDEFANIRSPNFMGRVRVEYNNGVVVYINRNRDIAGAWILDGLPDGEWYNYNVNLRGVVTQGIGPKPSEPLVLPPECGWVCYSPR